MIATRLSNFYITNNNNFHSKIFQIEVIYCFKYFIRIFDSFLAKEFDLMEQNHPIEKSILVTNRLAANCCVKLR